MLIILEFQEWDVVSLNYDQGVDGLVPPGGSERIYFSPFPGFLGPKPVASMPSSQQQACLSITNWPPLLSASPLHQNLTVIRECGLLRLLPSLRSAG